MNTPLFSDKVTEIFVKVDVICQINLYQSIN